MILSCVTPIQSEAEKSMVSMVSSKRKRIVLTIEEKNKIKDLENAMKLARIYGKSIIKMLKN